WGNTEAPAFGDSSSVKGRWLTRTASTAIPRNISIDGRRAPTEGLPALRMAAHSSSLGAPLQGVLQLDHGLRGLCDRRAAADVGSRDAVAVGAGRGRGDDAARAFTRGRGGAGLGARSDACARARGMGRRSGQSFRPPARARAGGGAGSVRLAS